MKRLAAILISIAALVAAPPASADIAGAPAGLYPPMDAAVGDASFAQYRAELTLAAQRRDVEAVLALSDPAIFEKREQGWRMIFFIAGD